MYRIEKAILIIDKMRNVILFHFNIGPWKIFYKRCKQNEIALTKNRLTKNKSVIYLKLFFSKYVITKVIYSRKQI